MKTKKPRFATKILALVLSMLMLLGAMPVAFAAVPPPAPVEEWPTIDGKAELIVGQYYSNLKIVGGSSPVDGHFALTSPDATPRRIGAGRLYITFYPDNTAEYSSVRTYLPVTVIKSEVAELKGTVTVKPLKVGQKLSEAEFIKSEDFAITSYDTTFKPVLKWETPGKVMDTVGTTTETLIVSGEGTNEASMNNFKLAVDVTVGNAEAVAEITELPKASEIKLGQTLADSVLTGGLVAKDENPVAGKFAWKDSTIAPAKAGTANYTAVFTPDDPTACAPIETQVAVTTGKGVVEVTEWPAITAELRGGCSVHDIVTLEGGSANVPGKFQVSADNKNPEKMGPADVVILFVPDDRTNYDIVRKTFTVNFEAATPEPGVSVRFGANFDSIRRKEVYISGSLGEGYNTAKDQATGTLYMVLDGEKIAQTGRLSYSHTYVSEDTIAPGEHTVYTEYVAGENDVFKSAVSHVETFVVEAFPDVTVNDSTGTVVEEYKAGATVKVTAAEHEKSYYDFTGWTAEGVELTEEELAQQTISFTMPEGDVNLTANYKLNFKNFVKFAFEQIGVKLMALIQQGIEWIKGLRP